MCCLLLDSTIQKAVYRGSEMAGISTLCTMTVTTLNNVRWKGDLYPAIMNLCDSYAIYLHQTCLCHPFISYFSSGKWFSPRHKHICSASPKDCFTLYTADVLAVWSQVKTVLLVKNVLGKKHDSLLSHQICFLCLKSRCQSHWQLCWQLCSISNKLAVPGITYAIHPSPPFLTPHLEGELLDLHPLSDSLSPSLSLVCAFSLSWPKKTALWQSFLPHLHNTIGKTTYLKLIFQINYLYLFIRFIPSLSSQLELQVA